MEKPETSNSLKRRDLFKGAGLAGLGLATLSRGLAAERLKNVRVGVVGTGGKGHVSDK